MIRAITARILRQILLVIVGAEAIYCTDISGLGSYGQCTGRLSVDVDVDLPVDQDAVRLTQCPSLTRGHCRLLATKLAVPGSPHLQRRLPRAHAHNLTKVGGVRESCASPNLRRSHPIEER